MRRFFAPRVLVGAFLVLGALIVTGCDAKEEAQASPVAQSSSEESNWGTSIDDGLAKAKAEGKMVLVDFTADW